LSSLAAFVVYVTLSILFFGLGVLSRPTELYVGTPSDPVDLMWFLAWWPHALGHRLHPFLTDVVWAPIGFNLAWATSLPGLSLVMAPVTQMAGPVVAYNILALLAPALAAWGCFVLCRGLTGKFWPALAGGYVFGFSTYVLGQLTSHVHLAFVALVPLAVHLAVRHLMGRLSARIFVAALGVVLAAQFTIANEIFATLAVFGAMTVVIGLAVAPVAGRRALLRTSVWIAAAFGVAAVLLAPYLYFMFAFGTPHGPIQDVRVHSADLLNFVVPTPVTLIGGDVLRPIADRFLGNYGESTAYVGLGLIALVAAFAREAWRHPWGKLLLLMLAVVTVASLGPQLNVLGRSTVSLPWRPMLALPLIQHALPVRFTLYVFLVLAIIVAFWLQRGASGWRWAAVAGAILLLLPNVTSSWWRSAVRIPPFFGEGIYRQYISAGEHVLQIPIDNRADGMMWHLVSGMSYRIVGGYVGPAPPEFVRWPIVPALFLPRPVLDAERHLKAFLGATGVTTVIVGEGSGDPWAPLIASLGVAPVRVGGVALYRVPPEVARSYGARTRVELEQRAKSAQVAALIAAAETALARGVAREEITPRRLQGLQLLPAEWGGYRADQTNVKAGRHFWTTNGLWLGPRDDGIGVGVLGTPTEVEPIVQRYRRHARVVVVPPSAGGLLLLGFDRNGLAAAAREIW
jgi:hypothetical protein